jgi:hypothetical protein
MIPTRSCGCTRRWPRPPRRILEVGREAIERSHRFWPRWLRELPAYHEARRRLAGKAGPDPMGALLHRLPVGEAARRG